MSPTWWPATSAERGPRRRWSNDYGDIPRWYWGPAFQRGRRRCNVTGKLLAVTALAMAGRAALLTV